MNQNFFLYEKYGDDDVTPHTKISYEIPTDIRFSHAPAPSSKTFHLPGYVHARFVPGTLKGIATPIDLMMSTTAKDSLGFPTHREIIDAEFENIKGKPNVLQ